MLSPLRLSPLSPRQIEPQGWLRRQLLAQARGLAGNLDKLWPDVRDSRWIGGEREGWERVPYWLDGFIPLAALLRDAGMMARAKRYVDAILQNQQDDGWLCPCEVVERSHYDMWALFLLLKVLVLYHGCTGDTRIQPAVYKALRQYDRYMDANTPFNWAAARWFEALIPIFWLYERTGEAWLPALAQKLRVQGFDYEALFDDWRNREPRRSWSYTTHVVNLAMMLKAGALKSRLWGGDGGAFASKALSNLERDHSIAAGPFTGDECLAGDSPVRGVELCAVVEAMYSYEVLLSVTGDPGWADRLEGLAFNALPAATTADLWAHQYDQMTNQVQCTPIDPEHVPFGTNGGEAHLFGLEPNYGCCTANFGQGWPKLALAAFMKSPGGLVSTVPVPCRVNTRVGEAQVVCSLETDYPFRGRLAYHIAADRPATFDFGIRIPKSAASATVDGAPAAPGTIHTLRRNWQGDTEIVVELAFETRFVPRPRETACLWRGPLLYSVALDEQWLPREYTRNGVARKFPYCDYEVTTPSPWNWAFAGDAFSHEEHEVPPLPFDGTRPAVTLEGPMAPIPWGFEHGVCKPQPDSLQPLGPARKVTFIPYGCTGLRMTEMPRVQESTAPEAKEEACAPALV